MTSPSPTLRCRCCEYDIASLVEKRGLDDPGVCPECGADLRPSLVEDPGLEVQQTWSTPSYLRFLRGAFIYPLRTADEFNLHFRDGGTLVFLNCVVSGFVLTVVTGIGGALQALGQRGMVDISVPSMLISVLAYCVVFVIALLLGAGAVGIGIALLAAMLGLRPKAPVVYAGLDIGTVWLVPWPALLIAAVAVPDTLPVVSPWIDLSAAMIALLPPALVPIIAFAIVIRLRRRVAP